MTQNNFNRIYLRFHARLILAITAMSGFTSSHLLLKHTSMEIQIRYLVSAVISYVTFIILMYGWKSYLEGLPPIQAQTKKVDPKSIVTEKERHWTDYVDFPDLGASWDDFLIGIAVVLIFAILIYASAYIIIEVPILMAEVVLSGLASSVFYKSIRKADDDIFIFKVIRETFLLGLALIVFYFSLGLVLSAMCPTVQKISDIFSSTC